MIKQQRRRGGAIRTVATVGFAAGAGYLLGILFAPASGQVTRRRIAMKAQAFRKTAVKKLGQTQKVLACKATEARAAATEWITEHMPHNGNGNGHRRVAHHA